MKLRVALAVLAWVMASPVPAGTVFGALSNFDAVNDTPGPCHGFEIELEDIRARDVTYTFDFQRYGVPKITEDTVVVNGVTTPRTFIRWMSPYDQAQRAFVKATPVAQPGFQNTGGHLCYIGMQVNNQPYEVSGCEHFGVGTTRNPAKATYRWMREDPAAPGQLIADGSPVSIPAPTWTVNPVPGAPPVVAAIIPVPPPPAVVPVPYLPDAEFGVAVWAKVYETESESHVDLEHLVADDEAVPGNLGDVPNPGAVTEIEWQILQTDAMNPSANELVSERQMREGAEAVTRRYEFYKYVGPYEIDTPDGPNTGTNEALCTRVADDDRHGVGEKDGIDCSVLIVVGEYIGAQNAAANVAMPLAANGTDLGRGEAGVRFPDRPLIFGGSGGPYAIAFSGQGTLPATNPGEEFVLDPITGVLSGGVPNGPGTASFTVHATDLVEPSQPAVDATFTLTIVPAVTVDEVLVPGGAPGVATIVALTASGGESPFAWSVAPLTAGLETIVFGNDLSLVAAAPGSYDFQVGVADSLGGSHVRTLSYAVSTPGCVGACGGGDVVTLADIATLTDIALGRAQPDACAQGNPAGADVTVALIVAAVGHYLHGCPVS